MSGYLIERCAVHQIDHIKRTAVVASGSLLTLDEDTDAFLRSHIEQSLQHRHIRTGCFLSGADPEATGVPSVEQAARSAISGGDFLTASVEIAEALFYAVGTDKRVSVSDLFVCSLSLNGYDNAALAVLKMDLHSGLRTRYEVQSDGTILATIEIVPDVITDRELQKVAIIYPKDVHDFDLSILDTQSFRGGYARPVASFFMSKFLSCAVNLNQQDVTYGFVDAAREFGSKMVKNSAWDEYRSARFLAAAHAEVGGNLVDVTAFAIEHTDDEIEATAFVDEFRSIGASDLAFEPDKQVAKKLQPVRIALANGITITVRSEDAADYRREPVSISPGDGSLLPPGQRVGRVAIGANQYAVIRLDSDTSS